MTDLVVIKVTSTSDLPKRGKLLTELPASGTVYVYDAPTLLRDAKERPVIKYRIVIEQLS